MFSLENGSEIETVPDASEFKNVFAFLQDDKRVSVYFM
jgi:hypothetical protein